MRMTKGFETRATRSLARQMYGGPNSMKQIYRDEGCKIWWVDGYGHGGFFVALTDPSKCHPYLILPRPQYGGTHEWKYAGGGVALTVHVYEEDVEWSWLVNDNPWLAEIMARTMWKHLSAAQILEAAKKSEASYPRSK